MEGGGGEGFFKVEGRGGEAFLKLSGGGGQRIFEAKKEYPGTRFFQFNCLVPYCYVILLQTNVTHLIAFHSLSIHNPSIGTSISLEIFLRF